MTSKARKTNINKKKRKLNIPHFILTLSLCIYGLLILYPFYNSVLISIIPYKIAIRNSFLLFPPELDITSYEFIFSWKSLMYGFRTTGIIVVFGVAYNLFLTVTLAYVLSKPIPGRKYLNLFIVFTMFFQGGLIPGYLLIKDLGMYDKYAAMIVPLGINIMNLMIMRSFFQGLPEEISEAAKLDGAGEYTILFRVCLPLSKPMLATIGLYYGVERWNEWYNGMLYMRSLEKWPLQLRIRDMIQSVGTVMNQIPESSRPTAYPLGIQMAGIIVSIIPVALIYPFLQKYFVKGLTLGGVKG